MLARPQRRKTWGRAGALALAMVAIGGGSATRARAQQGGAAQKRPPEVPTSPAKVAPAGPGSAAAPSAVAWPSGAGTAASNASATAAECPPCEGQVANGPEGDGRAAGTTASAAEGEGGEGGGKLGVRYALETIRVRGNRRTRDRVILRYVPFRPGDDLDVDDHRLELTRFRLLGTGYFSDVQLSLSKGSRRGAVALNIDVVERNTIVVNDLWLGISADATPDGSSRPLTAYGGADIAENNFYGTGVSLGGALAVADRQSAYRLRFADPSFLGSRWIVAATLLYNDARDFFGTRDVRFDPPPGESGATDFALATYTRKGGELGAGYDVATSTRVHGSYHLEVVGAHLPVAASHRRGLDVEPIEFHLLDGRSLLSYLTVQVDDDTRDEPVLPTRGHHVQLGADVGLSALGSDYGFLRFNVRGSYWWPLSRRGPGGGGNEPHVFRIDAFGGAVFGDAPLFMRFYVGDLTDFLPDRVLDLNFDRRPPPNFLRTSVVEQRYEELAARVNAEYRVPLYRGRRAVYGIDLFGSAGVYAIASRRDISAPARGYHGFAKFPVDLTFNLGLRVNTSAGGFLFAFANALAFFPIRSEARP